MLVAHHQRARRLRQLGRRVGRAIVDHEDDVDIPLRPQDDAADEAGLVVGRDRRHHRGLREELTGGGGHRLQPATLTGGNQARMPRRCRASPLCCLSDHEISLQRVRC